MAEPRWLDDTEMRAWRALVAVHLRLFTLLDHELRRRHGLTGADYGILVNLSEAPDRSLRMSELAQRVLESKSRLSPHVARLEAQGLVERRPCTSDRRGAHAVLTDAGARRLATAAPDHVHGVRAHFVDLLGRRQLEVLGQALERVDDHVADRLRAHVFDTSLLAGARARRAGDPAPP